jgi:predicted flap endonuclease-1-like 5' DNA nuclease
MSYPIQDIQGIGPSYAEKLSEAGVKTTKDLLFTCKTPQGRQSLSARTGLTTTLLLKWCNMADLMRISGIGPQYAELLEASGVDTVKELRTRNPQNLSDKMKTVNREKKLKRSVPAHSMVEHWVDSAKGMNSIITY